MKFSKREDIIVIGASSMVVLVYLLVEQGLLVLCLLSHDDFFKGALYTSFEVGDIGLGHGMHHELCLISTDLFRDAI